MIVELGLMYEGLRRATIDPALPSADYALLESASDHLELLSAANDSIGLRAAARRCRAHYVTADDLKPLSSETLRLAQKSVDTVLDSGVYADGLLDRAAVKAELAEKEWAVAVPMRECAALRRARWEEAVFGPLPLGEARDRLRARMRDESTVPAGVGALVAALESCAVQVESADTVYEMLQERDTIVGLGNEFRDLVASFPARGERAEDITDLEQQNAAVFDALCELAARAVPDW